MGDEMEFSWNAGGQEPMDYSPIKPGKYSVCIIEVKQSRSRNNDPMIEVQCVIDQEESRGRRLWHRVTFIGEGRPGAGIAVHFLKTIGEPFDIHNDFKVKPGNWIGRRFIATIINEKYVNPETREERVSNVIKGVEPVPVMEIENKGLAAKYAPKPMSAQNDEQVPF